MSDERPITESRQHWSVIVFPWITLGLLALVAGIIVLILIPGHIGSSDTGRARVIAGVVLAVAVVLWTGYHYLRWLLLTYLLTDRRIVVESGVLSRTTESIALDRIQNTTIKRPLGDRLIGAGDIEIESAGRDGVEVLHRIPHAQAFYTALQEAMEALRGGPAATRPL
ncbi:MAG: PH domain-containing protein [Candidatus Dormibacteraeota bacterium]|nr:PH domain-containing protein [Candidatus Dormibacteraeota bacterium]MBV9524398.1 PH domain-containing protein [Candidatus Dormibacteraeota bacterium]